MAIISDGSGAERTDRPLEKRTVRADRADRSGHEHALLSLGNQGPSELDKHEAR